METLDEVNRRGGLPAIRFIEEFLYGDDRIVRTLRALVGRLDAMEVAYAVVGDLAMAVYGHVTTGGHAEVLLNAAGWARARPRLIECGYLEAPRKGRTLVDAATSLPICFRVTGDYPGDRDPKPVAFPEPAGAGRAIDGVKYVELTKLMELKLAAGMSRLLPIRENADAPALIVARRLSWQFRELLHEGVRGKYDELWHVVQDVNEEQ